MPNEATAPKAIVIIGFSPRRSDRFAIESSRLQFCRCDWGCSGKSIDIFKSSCGEGLRFVDLVVFENGVDDASELVRKCNNGLVVSPSRLDRECPNIDSIGLARSFCSIEDGTGTVSE